MVDTVSAFRQVSTRPDQAHPEAPGSEARAQGCRWAARRGGPRRAAGPAGRRGGGGRRGTMTLPRWPRRRRGT